MGDDYLRFTSAPKSESGCFWAPAPLFGNVYIAVGARHARADCRRLHRAWESRGGSPLLVFLGSSRSAGRRLEARHAKIRQATRLDRQPQLSNRERGERSEDFKGSAVGSDPLTGGCSSVTWRKGDSSATLHDAPFEGVIAAPQDWCPNPSATTCLRVRGKSMMPLIHDGYILAVDSSQTD